MRRSNVLPQCAVAALLCVKTALALDPKPVGSVELLGGAPGITLETQEGQPRDNAKLRNDLKSLYRTGRFSDVHVETNERDEAIDVVFRLQPKHTLRLRRIEVKPPTAGIDLQYQPGSRIDLQGAQQIGEKVRQQLEASGHPFVSVDAVLLPRNGGEADLEVRIDEGRQVDIKNVTLTGDLGEPGAKARKALKWTTSKTMIPRIPGIWNGWHILPGYSDNAVQYDAANLRSFYFARGYFDAMVRADTVNLTNPKTTVKYDIQAGPRYAIREFRLLGAAGERTIAPRTGDMFPVREACNTLLDERRAAERAGVLDFSARIEVRDLPERGFPERPWATLHAT